MCREDLYGSQQTGKVEAEPPNRSLAAGGRNVYLC